MKRTTDSAVEKDGKRQKVDSAANGFNGVGDIDNAEDLKRTELSIPILPKDAKVLLLDIEGLCISHFFLDLFQNTFSLYLFSQISLRLHYFYIFRERRTLSVRFISFGEVLEESK